MASKSTLNSGNFMNPDNQLDSTICVSENHDISFRNTLDSTKESVGVNWTSSLLDGAVFIVSSGSCQNENIPNYWQRSVDLLTHTFGGVASLNDFPEYFFHGLIKSYADLYNIDLHLIVYYNNKYVIVDKSNFIGSNEEPCKRENHAFIWCSADNTFYAPLFINNISGRILTVFKTDEVFVWQRVESFVNRINQELADTDRNQTEQHVNLPEEDLSHMVVDDTFSSTNHSTSLAVRRPETALNGHTFIEHMLQQIYQLKNTLKPQLDKMLLGSEVLDFNITSFDELSPQGSAALISQRLMLISEVVQMAVEQISQNNDATISSNIIAEDNNHQHNTAQLNEPSHSEQTDQNLADVQIAVPPHLSDTIQVPQTTPVTTPAQLQYDAPEILTQPKTEWHYRNMKDLGKKRMPFLAGEGPQRTPIRVKVPQQGAHPMHLGIKIQTHDNREHRSKVLVPEHTSVNMDSFSNDNNLNRLQFDQCNPLDYFDPVKKYVYLAISAAEHVAQSKDVQIYMFNMYQSGSITREIIQTEQLEKCKLVFWLCTLEDGVYKPISTPSSSCLIEEA